MVNGEWVSEKVSVMLLHTGLLVKSFTVSLNQFQVTTLNRRNVIGT